MRAPTVALLALVAGVSLLPEHVALLLHQSRAAWEYVAYGLETAALWGLLLVLAPTRPVRAIALLGAAEGLARPVCRLAFPMDRPPKLQPNQTLCDAAFGQPVSTLSLFGVLLVAAAIWGAGR